MVSGAYHGLFDKYLCMFRATVSPLVVGVPGACYCKFNSRTLAEAAFEDAQATGGVCIV